MSKNRFKTFRVEPSDQRLISSRMLRDGCSESEAIRSLIRDGANVPQSPVLSAQIARPEDLAAFAAAMALFHKDFMFARSRLAVALPDPKDTALMELAKKWRDTSTGLVSRARDLYVRAERLAEIMMGLGMAENETLKQAKIIVVDNIKRADERLADPAESEKSRSALNDSLNYLKVFLHALELLGF